MLRLREARKENSMTQTQVAKYLNVTTATYNRYEKGVIRPDPDTLKNLASLFNVSVDYLLGLPPSARNLLGLQAVYVPFRISVRAVLRLRQLFRHRLMQEVYQQVELLFLF